MQDIEVLMSHFPQMQMAIIIRISEGDQVTEEGDQAPLEGDQAPLEGDQVTEEDGLARDLVVIHNHIHNF